MGFSGTMFQQTVPWHEKQFIYVGGYPYVYHGEGEALTVEFPGGTCRRLTELRLTGRHIKMPAVFRNENPGIIKNNPETRAPHRSKTGLPKVPKL